MTKTRTQVILDEAWIELQEFWATPEADLLRDGETHVLFLVDQRDPRNHGVLRRLGTEPNLDPNWSKWTTLILPRSDFKPAIREEAAKKRSHDLYPLLILDGGQVVITSLADARAQHSN